MEERFQPLESTVLWDDSYNEVPDSNLPWDIGSPQNTDSDSKDSLNHEYGELEGTRNFSLSKYLASLFVWYIASTAIVLYIKWLHSADKYGFKYPVFMTLISTFFQLIHSSSLLRLRGKDVVMISPKGHRTIMIMCGVLSGLDIGLANSGLMNISVPLFTVVRSTTPIFTLFVTSIKSRHIPELRSLTSCVLIMIGVTLTAVHDVSFDLKGYVLAQMATILGSLRWVFTQEAVRGIPYQPSYSEIDYTLTLLLQTIVYTIITMLTISFLMEGPKNIATYPLLLGSKNIFTTLCLALTESVLGLIVISSEIYSISMISAMAFIMIGITKEILTIIVSWLVFKDEFTPIQLIGVAISISGLFVFQFLCNSR